MNLLKALVTTLILLLQVAAAHCASDCNALDPTKPNDFLACVARNSKNVTASKGVALESAFQKDLSRLSQTIGYVGRKEDLDTLKALSRALKAFPNENQDSIIALDNAISANVLELRSVVSPASLTADAERDQYSTFVGNKLAYLLTDAPKFYDGGPFEIITRSNLAIALQEAYFLDLEAGSDFVFRHRLEGLIGVDRKSWLLRSITVLDDIIKRLTSTDHDYLPADLRKHSVNDFRYRRVTALLLLNDRSKYKEALSSLAVATQDFSLATSEIDHIYVYKLFYTPYRLRIVPDSDGLGHQVNAPRIDDPELIKKLYNPAQLALVSCSVHDGEGAPLQLSQLVKGLVLSDYYVVVGSSNDRSVLDKMSNDIRSVMQNRNDDRNSLASRVNQLEVAGFSRQIQDGARECGVPDGVARKIFAPFAFQLLILKADTFGRFQFHLTIGGRLNADQARAVASYLNQTRELQTILTRTSTSSAYIARMKAGE